MKQVTERPAGRAAGVLLHPTSLPGPHGVGDLGASVYHFIEFLAAARQALWQVMPLGPLGLGNSPYAARSAFAGNPLLIALDQLAGRGWFDQAELEASMQIRLCQLPRCQDGSPVPCMDQAPARYRVP